MNDPRVHILMYHSVSRNSGPTCIAPSTFEDQLEALSALGYAIVTLRQVRAWQEGLGTLPPLSAAITFDDALADFESEAAPRLSHRAFASTVFVPTSWVGRQPGWTAAGYIGQGLMSWATIRDLSIAGVQFGSHTCTHADLTALRQDELDGELRKSREILEHELAVPVDSFAAPYGRTNTIVRKAISTHYSLAVGVKLASARQKSDRFDLPRLEMHYFRDPGRWRAFLKGEGRAYFSVRQLARSARARIASLGRRTPP